MRFMHALSRLFYLSFPQGVQFISGAGEPGVCSLPICRGMAGDHKDGSIRRAFHGKWIHFNGSGRTDDLGVSCNLCSS